MKRLIASLTAIGLLVALCGTPAAFALSPPLPIPPLLEDLDPASERAEFELTVRRGTTSFIDGYPTRTYGYNGSYLGPVIRLRRGEDVNIRVRNELNEETTVHWHGLIVPGRMDGGPHYPIEQGGEWKVHFAVDQPAATLWYHPHPHGRIGEQIYRGLAGLMIIDDEVSDRLDIPRDYGVDDVPLIIQDRRFGPDGTLQYMTHMMDLMHGMMGDVITVNGVIFPQLLVNRGRIRLRLLNASNARVYDLTLSDGRPFFQIASDGGLLEYPLELRRLTLAPGERAEIVVDFSRYREGRVITLRSPRFEIMRFLVSRKISSTAALPERLAEIERMEPRREMRTRLFILSGSGGNSFINYKQFNPGRIDEVLLEGATEIWEIVNGGMASGMMGGGNMMGGGMRGPWTRFMAHPFHIHGVQFQILTRDGRRPPPGERGWKDTVLVSPGEIVRLIAEFRHPGLYVYHCHILEHDDAGMMGTFEVVEK